MKPLVECIREFIDIRRVLHAQPELSAREFLTSELISQKLKEWGFDVFQDIGGNDVVGVLKQGQRGKSIGIRADFDALPIHEETGLDYCSGTSGVMHACGHDGHTAILLAACYEIARAPFVNGTFVAIFQPAEEIGIGAKAMFKDSQQSRFPVDAYFGLHNIPGISTGRFGLAEGPFWAGVDDIDIQIQGYGGHAGAPHLTRDPTVAACHLGVALQTIVARSLDPIEACVLTIGALNVGCTNNVIPDSAGLKLNLRTFSSEVRELVRRRIRELIQGALLHKSGFGRASPYPRQI